MPPADDTAAPHPWAARFLSELAAVRGASPQTVRRYTQSLGLVQAAHPQPETVTAAALTALLTRRHAQGDSPRSLAAMVSAWRGFFAWAVLHQLRPDNPSLTLKTPKIPAHLPKALAPDVPQVFLGKPYASALPRHAEGAVTAWDLRDQAVLEMLYASGLRGAELLALDAQPSAWALGWVDAAARTIHVTGKGNLQRTVPITHVALAALANWLVVRPTAARAEETALFVGTRGGRMSGTELRRITQRQVAKTDFAQSVHPHMLRHSFASHMLQSSGDLRAVQELLGHAQIRSTQIYTKLDFQHLAKVYDELHPRARRTKTPIAPTAPTAPISPIDQ
jgi:integrase/recombinase XerC